MFALPVSRATVSLRAPSGHDDVFLVESAGDGVGLRIDMVKRLAPPTATNGDWASLPYVDVDAALLALRRFLAGDRLVAEIVCSACAAWCDLSLSISDYFKAHRPRRSPTALPAPIPAVGPVLAAVRAHGPEAAPASLEREYLRDCEPREARRAIAVLDKVAPPLAGALEGTCPHCGASVSAWFDPGAFVISELRSRAATVFEDVHRLASRYGWTEDTILAMPGPRRAIYAELIAAEAGSS